MPATPAPALATDRAPPSLARPVRPLPDYDSKRPGSPPKLDAPGSSRLAWEPGPAAGSAPPSAAANSAPPQATPFAPQPGRFYQRLLHPPLPSHPLQFRNPRFVPRGSPVPPQGPFGLVLLELTPPAALGQGHLGFARHWRQSLPAFHLTHHLQLALPCDLPSLQCHSASPF
jgi:hypothetical protein